MSRFKPAMALAIVAFSCCAPARASTAGWMVGGTQLLGTAKIKTADVASYSEVSIPGVAVRCEGSSIEVEGGVIRSAASLELPRIVFKGCKSTAEACQLPGSTIETDPLLGAGITLDGSLAIKGALLAKPTFMALEFQGEECALAGTVVAIKGSVDFLASGGQDERASQLILMFSLPNQLKVASSEANFHFHGSLALESNSPWRFL